MGPEPAEGRGRLEHRIRSAAARSNFGMDPVEGCPISEDDWPTGHGLASDGVVDEETARVEGAAATRGSGPYFGLT